ncbi:hypothetical protein D9758_017886 [Tetrapyrgos nigripes]|uniref:Transposase n=1 Tax=Tetrapyrgos nigripes TaxID=182062 RepID=A0A8H5FDA8_9AGAR|nr:hypothetical protein D9758_017886 [Tetrapyrgos nigripes]
MYLALARSSVVKCIAGKFGRPQMVNLIACNCTTFNCNGRKIPRKTRSYHDRQDLKHRLSKTSAATPIPPAPSRILQLSQVTNSQLEPFQHIFEDDFRIVDSFSEQVEDTSTIPTASSQTSTEPPLHAGASSNEDIGDVWNDVDEEEDNVDLEVPPMPASSAGTGAFAIEVGDPVEPNGNFSDPFQYTHNDGDDDIFPASFGSIDATNTPAPIFLLYLLVSWLHTYCKLPFAACNVVLVVVFQIIQTLGAAQDPLFTPSVTLKTVLSHLGIEPNFQILPCCPECLEPHPSSTSPHHRCHRCPGNPHLFKTQAVRDKRAKPGTTSHRPRVQFAMKSVKIQLREILSVPEVEEVLDSWRNKPRSPGVYTDNFDGKVCQTIPGPDGRCFFENPPPHNELRIGLSLGVDCMISPSHTSGPMSLNIINLPPHLRYRTSNILLWGILPGPKEQDCEQVQFFLHILVNELLRLWRHGFIVKTNKFPFGRLVRVILICVICDKPAAHKLGGFGSHSHTFFCTRCWIKLSEKATAAAFQKNAFMPRTHRQHAAHGHQYSNLDTKKAREDFVKQHAARLVKNHFYSIWILFKVLRKTQELKRFHDILSQIPQIWQEFGTAADKNAAEQIRLRRLGDFEAAVQARKAAAAARRAHQEAERAANPPRRTGRKHKQTRQAEEFFEAAHQEEEPHGDNDFSADFQLPAESEAGEEDDSQRQPNLHPDDPQNFFKLSAALKILLAYQLTKEDAQEADTLLRSYCMELLHLYGPTAIKPNHHYCTHTTECVEDFGPLHGFWTFLFERINKVLKNYNSSNHSGGELEVSFFREFHRTIQQSRVMAAGYQAGHQVIQNCLTAMYKATADDRRTVQALSRELDEASEDGGLDYQLGALFTEKTMDSLVYSEIFHYLSNALPFAIRSFTSPGPAIPLLPTAVFFDYVIIGHRRYQASRRSASNINSLIAVADLTNTQRYRVGELTDIIVLNQPGLSTVHHLGRVSWLVPCGADEAPQLDWAQSANLKTSLWRHQEYNLDRTIIPLNLIKSHVVLADLAIGNAKLWVTQANPNPPDQTYCPVSQGKEHDTPGRHHGSEDYQQLSSDTCLPILD